jgi:hypothetical protein
VADAPLSVSAIVISDKSQRQALPGLHACITVRGTGDTAVRGEGTIMSIAQVLHVSGGPGVGATPPPETVKMTEATKALDGCERIYTMANSQTGEGMAVIVWRDEAAQRSAADHIAADNEALQDLLKMSIKPGPVYDSFMEL